MSFVRTPLLFALVLSMSAVVTLPLRAQISAPGTPYSFRTALADEAPTYRLPGDRLEARARQLAAGQQAFHRQDEDGLFTLPPGYHGIEVPVDLGFDNAGRWTTLPDGGRLWRLRIASDNAATLNLLYDVFWMPPGARFFLYGDDRSVVLGSFTERNNKAYGGFATDLLPGDAATLEYYEPAGVTEPGRLHVSAVVHGLPEGVDPSHLIAGPYTPLALPCSINTACSEGNGWDDEINAVVKIITGSGSCSGVLLNNTREDETPYVLTANHCGSPSVGQSVNWVFKFNYQSGTCADPAQDPSSQSITGGVVRAADGGRGDFTLVELSQPIPVSFNVHFAGWSTSNSAPQSGVTIGHPRGDIKKITLDDDPITTNATTYWQAIFDHGTIEASSSGSPLFNQNHQVVGHLKASLTLDPNACSGPGGDDNYPIILFPKLSYIWDQGASGERVSDFLDPDGTGAGSMPPLPGTGGGTPASIWINEINADGTGATETDEFVEIVGPPGTNLNNYTVDIYACSGGSAVLQSTETLNNMTLQPDYQDFGVCVLGGPSMDPGLVDQTFSGAGSDVLPDGSGLIVLRDASGAELFDYQYDTETGGAPDHCPPNRATRSTSDPAGAQTMGFINANPTSTDFAFSGMSGSPGIQNPGQTLPVELVSFEAVLDGEAVLLRWETASETNNAGFEIQHRTGDDDVRAYRDRPLPWETMDFVAGQGTTELPQAYTHRVASLAPGRHVFRLKQVDFDGTFEYSPEVEVAVDVPGAYHLSAAYPNPFNPETSFSLSVARGQEVQVAVYNLLGRRVAVLFDGFLEEASARAFTFDARALPSGLYLIRAVGERFIASETVTLLK